MMDNFYILALPSIHYIMKLEKESVAQGIPVDLVPTPRQISSDCGMVVKIPEQSLEKMLQLANRQGMPAGKLYRFQKPVYEFVQQTGPPEETVPR
jgi:hypothetical protein